MNSFDRFRLASGFLRSFVPPILAMARNGADKPIEYSDLLEEHIKRRGDRPALIGEGSSMTWAELDAYANQTAHWALSQGLGRGDVVALLMENRPEYVATWLGLSRVGVVTALLNTHLTGDRLAHCIQEAHAEHWIVGEELVDAATSARGEMEKAASILVVGSGASDAKGPDLAVLGDRKSLMSSFDDARACQSSDAVPDSAREGRKGADGLFLIYTSGTTGLPKAARVSHTKAIGAGLSNYYLQGLTPNDRMYICLPLYHSAGGMMAAGGGLFAGGALVLSKKFSAKRFWSDCAQHEVTTFQYIGELCRYLLNSPSHPDERRHKVRVVMGNGLRPEVWTPFQERFGIDRIVEFYGATEGNLPIFNIPGRVGAVGYLPGFARKALGMEIVKFDIDNDELVRDAKGRCIRCAPGEAGELVVKITKTARFEGYTNDAASEKKILRGGFVDGDTYFRTGDLLRADEDGFYYFVDRIGDTFRWKGENVSTSEVAEVVSVVEGVEEANVYGVEIPGMDGRAGMVALVATDQFDLEAFGSRVEEELAFYARPIFLRMLPQMEITGTFKHRKVDLVKEGFDPTTISDPILFRDSTKGCYVPLDGLTREKILNGEIRV